MRVITVTFHRAENYGAVLQCYALQQALIKIGNNVKVLDLGKERQMYQPVFQNIRYMHRRIIFNFQRWRDRKILHVRGERFRTFVDQHLELTPHYTTIEELFNQVPDADCYITGSDQVWNPQMYPELVQLYRLDFVKSGKKYSYAASFGKYIPSNKSDIWDSLRTYSMISVREKSAVDLLKKNGLQARIDIDPVFLLGKREWKSIMSDVRAQYDLPEHFILVFELIPRADMENIVSEIKAKYQLSCAVVVSLADKVCYYGDKCIRDAGPSELLGLINIASVVVSTSFHGAMLSLIMEKEIFALPVTAKERFVNVFNAIRLDSRVIEEKMTLENIKKIDYSIVGPILSQFKSNAISYLCEITKEDEKKDQL